MHGAGLARIFLWHWLRPRPRGAELVYCCDYISLALAPPPIVQHGARLLLRLYFPETQIQKLGPMTLTAFVDGQPLAPETFEKGGSYDFVRDIPACFLDTNLLPISFSFDAYSPRSGADGRDLGAVVLMAALEAK